jgi:hypothetical protein
MRPLPHHLLALLTSHSELSQKAFLELTQMTRESSEEMVEMELSSVRLWQQLGREASCAPSSKKIFVITSYDHRVARGQRIWYKWVKLQDRHVDMTRSSPAVQ